MGKTAALYNSIAIARWNHLELQAEVIELHVFADASKLAFGIAVYLRIVQNDEVSANLQVAKSKVAPLKILRIPRLELANMHLASKMAKNFIKKSNFEFASVHL